MLSFQWIISMCYSSFWKTWNMKTPLCICLPFKVIHSLVWERKQPKLLRNTTKYDNHTCFCLIFFLMTIEGFKKWISNFDLFVVVMIHNRTTWFWSVEWLCCCKYKAQTLHWPDLLCQQNSLSALPQGITICVQPPCYSFLKNTDVWLNLSFVKWPGFCFAVMNRQTIWFLCSLK